MKVLVIDDSAEPRLLLERELEGLGHEVLAADDGIRGWELFRGAGVEVVLSAWRLPGIDGAELCRRVRAEDPTPYPYFILLASADERGQVPAALEAGADDFLTKPFDAEELAARMVVAARATDLRRRLSSQQAELHRLRTLLIEDSRRDSLTGLGNRARQDEDLSALASRAERYGQSFGVALFDLDRFKALNEVAGQLAGDEVLRSVGSALAKQCRRGDAAYRHGGEEMLVAFPSQSLETTTIAAERMREAIESLAIPHPGLEPPGVVTVSVGVACLQPQSGDEVDMLLERAELGLQAAKDAGRNRVVARERAADRA